jgi:hypothetical protein
MYPAPIHGSLTVPQGTPAGSTPFQLGFFVFVARLSSFGLENALIQMVKRVAAVSLTNSKLFSIVPD